MNVKRTTAQLAFRFTLMCLGLLTAGGVTLAQSPQDSVTLQRVFDYQRNFQHHTEGVQQNVYMKYTFHTERRNVMLNLVPTMYTLAKGERTRMGESYCRLTYLGNHKLNLKRQVSTGNIAHYKKAMPTVLELTTPCIYEECVFDNYILSPFYKGNRRFYRYTVVPAQAAHEAVVTFRPRLANTQLITGKAYVDVPTGKITKVMFDGEFDMISFKVDVVQSDEEQHTLLPRSCHVDASFKFIGNHVRSQFDVVYGCPITLPDSIEDRDDLPLMERLRPVPLLTAEQQIYRQHEVAMPDTITGDSTEQRVNWWKDVAWEAISENLFKSLGTENEHSYVRLSPIIAPQYLSYSHKRGLSYKLKAGARYTFSPHRYITFDPEVGYNFKFKQLFVTAPLRMTYNPKRDGYAEIVVGNGNHITNSSVVDAIADEGIDMTDLDGMDLDFFKDSYIEVRNNIEAFDWLSIMTALSYHRRKAVNSAKMREMDKPDVYRSFSPILTLKVTPWHNGPLLTLDYERGISDVLKSELRYERWEFDASWKIHMRRMSLMNLRAGCGFYTNKHTSYFVDFDNFRDNFIPGGWDDDWTGQFQLLNSKWYNASEYYFRVNTSYESPPALCHVAATDWPLHRA